MIAGIDEAGRGPVIGPLVVAGVAVEDESILAVMECKDSKQLTAAKRESIQRRLANHPGVRIEVRIITAQQIDEERKTRNLNEIEIERFQDIGRTLGVATLVVDAADVDAARFGRAVSEGLPPGIKVVSEHRADENHLTVAAASIVAKVERDRLVAQLGRRLERVLPMPLGSGYASDPLTIAFLKAWRDRFGGLPEGTRLSWATARDLLAPQPTRLDEFAAK